jgi:HK97 family phage major capsid protein
MDIRERVIALNEQRLRAWEHGKALLDDVAAQKAEMSAEQRATWDRINTEINDIDEQVRQFVSIETREREAATLRDATDRLFRDAKTTSDVKTPEQNLRDFLRGEGDYANKTNRALEIDVRGAMRERALLRQGASADEIRTMAWDVTSGSLTVPTTLARTLYEVLEANICAMQMPVTMVTTNSGETMQFPKNTTHAVGTQIAAQGTAFGGSDPIMGRLQLDAFKYGSLIRVSNELLSDNGVDIAGFLGRDIGRALGRVIDVDLITGSGSSKPNGMTVVAGAGTNAPVYTGGSLITPTYEHLINTVYSVPDAYRARSAGWLMHDSSAGTLRKLRDGAGGTVGAVLWRPSLTQGIQGGQPDLLVDFPVWTDKNCATQGSNAIFATFGDWEAYYVRTVGNPVIETDNSVYFASDEVAFRGKWRVDGDYIDVSAVNVLQMHV